MLEQNVAIPHAQEISRIDASTAPRLLICSEGIPHESQGASLVLYFHYIDQLRQAGYAIRHILLLQGDGWSEADLQAYAGKMASLSGFEVLPVRADRFVFEGRLRHRVADAALTQVDALTRDFAPEIVLCFDILSAWLTARVAARRLVWLGDLRFQTVLYHAFYSARENPTKAVHVPSNWLSCQAWKAIYRTVLRQADQVIVASHSSIAALTPLGIRSEYEPYPWPESTGNRPANTEPALPKTPTFLFYGSLGGLGSRSALHMLAHKVFPLLRRSWGKGGFRVLIAGRGELPGWAQRFIEGNSEFETLGFVEDLDGLFARCHAVLVPINVPVGNRSRILAAMARRTLVIAHQNAALGNPDLVDGETCYLAASPAQFLERMQRAVDDRPTARAIATRGVERYRARFGVEAAGTKLLSRVNTLAAAPTTTSLPTFAQPE